MRVLLGIVLFIIFSAHGKGENYPGVNFGIFFKPTIMNDELSVIAGSRLGVNFTQNIYTGIAVNAVSFNSLNSYVIDPIIDKYPVLALNYVSLEIDYAISPQSSVFPSILLTIGYGAMNFRPPKSTIFVDGREKSYNPDYKLDIKNFIIFEPQVNLNMNFRSFYKLTIGLGYRFIPGLDYSPNNLIDGDRQMHLNESDLNGPTATFTVKFGSF